jgi:hypothetical protein
MQMPRPMASVTGGDAADFVRSVSPEMIVQSHEIMLSDVGQQSMAMFISPKMLTGVPLMIVPVGKAVSA